MARRKRTYILPGVTWSVDPKGDSVATAAVAAESGRAPDAETRRESAPQDPFTLAPLRRRQLPAPEVAFVDGCRQLYLGDAQAACRCLADSYALVDGAFLGGLLAYQDGRYPDAARLFEYVVSFAGRLGHHFRKYGFWPTVELTSGTGVTTSLGPDWRGALRALSAAYQEAGRPTDAVTALRHLCRFSPQDADGRLQLVELLAETWPEHEEAVREVLALTEGVANLGSAHAAVLYYRAHAMRSLGRTEGAYHLLMDLLRTTEDGPPELLRAVRYERALAYEAMGSPQKARADYEALYAEAPDYADVAGRLDR